MADLRKIITIATSNQFSSIMKFSSVAALEQIKRVNPLFLLTVLLPTLLATLYYGFIASDIYISESRFVVRSQERSTASPLGLILKGVGFSRAEDDAFAVQNFILSRDALKALEQEIQVRRAYDNSAIDIFDRFGGLGWDRSFENFYRYYQKQIEVQMDSTSGITDLSVKAYAAQDAYEINQHLLRHAEALVNKLNERGRQDLVGYATKEVAHLQEKAKAAALNLARYRNDKSVIDPEKQSTIPLQQVAKMQEDLVSSKAQLLQMESVARDNPQIPLLRQRVSVLEREIEVQSQRIAGGGDRSLASKAVEYQRLALEKEFADKMLASALSTLEQARTEAQRQQIYIERIVQPSLPDRAMEPRRLRGIFATLVVGLIAWGVLTLLIAGTKEHLD